jgi:ferredoxin
MMRKDSSPSLLSSFSVEAEKIGCLVIVDKEPSVPFKKCVGCEICGKWERDYFSQTSRGVCAVVKFGGVICSDQKKKEHQ